MKLVKAELTRFEKMSGNEKKENSHIPLTMYGIAKSAAVDARLVDPGAEDDPNSKTNEAVRQTLRSLKETASYRGTVAIFSDNYQNKASGFNLYDDIREKLIAEGVPADEVAVIRPGMSVKKKLDIFEKVNHGEIRVVLGSTFTLGTGVNIQERLHTLIHLDAPNRPMDYTQRNGRILRQGNLHKEMGKPVRVLRFGVEDSLDITAYQRLKTKGAIADSIMNGKRMMAESMTNRAIEEEEDVFGDTIAQLSGSEYAMLKSNAEKNVRKYESRKKQWEADQTYIHNAKPKLKSLILEAEQRAEANRNFLQAVRQAFPDGKTTEITAGKQTFTAIEEMSDFFKEHNKKSLEKMRQMKEGGEDTHIRELTVSLGGYTFKIRTVLSKDTNRDGGRLFSEVHRSMAYSCPELGLENVPVRQGLLRNVIEDITQNVITGKDYAERAKAFERNARHLQSELEQLLSREGRPFEFEKELAQAKKQYAEYSELMKKEMEEKEAKYAEIDKAVEAASDIAIPEDEDDLMRDSDTSYRAGDGAYTDAEVSFGNDPWAKMGMRRTARQQRAFAARERRRMAERVRNLAERLHLGNVDIVTDASALEGRQRRAKGFFSTRTGKITVVIPNHADAADAARTLLHEAVAHYGLRQLFGEHFDTFLDNVYANAEESIRREIAEMAARHGWDFRTATEEYLAGLAEDTDFERVNATWWHEIKRLFMDMLHKIGFEGFGGVTLTDNELRYILWRSYMNLSEPGSRRSILGEAEDVARQAELKVGDYAGTETGTDTRAAEEETELDRTNAAFNGELDTLTADNADSTILSLGRPSAILRAAGVEDRPMKLYGNKVMKKMRKHGFSISELHDLPNAVANPIAVFDNYRKDGNRAILTEMRMEGKNVLVSVTIGKEGVDADFNIVSSVFGKGNNNIIDWINKKYAKYINKEKALRYLHFSKSSILEASNNKELSSAAKIVETFENPAIEEDNNLLFRDGDAGIDDAANVTRGLRGEYDAAMRKSAFQVREAVQDSMLSLKTLMDIMQKHSGKKEIADWENAYMAENALSSRNKAEQDEYMRRYYLPMVEAMRGLKKEGLEEKDISRYAMAKHGIERNREMAVRAALTGKDGKTDGARLSEWHARKRDIREDDGLTTWRGKQEAMDAVAVREFGADLDARDYSGLAAIEDTEDVAEARARAYDDVERTEAGHDMKPLGDALRAATTATLDKLFTSGMIDAKSRDAIGGMYDYYVPLRGFDETTAEEVYAYIRNERRGTGGSPLKRAKGRVSMADSPFAHIMSMAGSAIMQGNRNLMKQKFLNFVLNRPSDLVSVSDMWITRDPATDEWVAAFPQIPEDATPEEVADIVRQFNENMQNEAESGNPDVRRVSGKTADIPYRTLGRQMSEHQVIVRRGGREIVLTVNGSPRAAMALNGMTNPDSDYSGMWGGMKKSAEYVNRQLSAWYTTRNPDFMASNFVRDALYTNSMVWVKESPRYAMRFHRNFVKFNPAKMAELFHKMRVLQAVSGRSATHFNRKFIFRKVHPEQDD